MITLTVFTPAFNRAHTIKRTYESLCRQTSKDFEWLIIDDGSKDDTRKWVESLGNKVEFKGQKFDWMGRPLVEEDEDHFIIQLPDFKLTYIYKPNGGLYTGYNVAYSTIKTELCVCIDSDDFLPDDAVEKIIKLWKEKGSNEYAGINGLDFDVRNSQPIGGYFPNKTDSANLLELKHHGDTKQVMRTDLMKEVAPQIGFQNEKDFNPHYMQMQVLDEKPMLLLNDNICWVEYQIGADSMSQAIFKQFKRSPKSYAKYRLMELKMQHGNNAINKLRLCAHYVSACIFCKKWNCFINNPEKMLTVLSLPIAIILNLYIRYKAK